MTDSTTRDALLSVIRRELRGLNVRVAKQACSRFIEAGLLTDADFDSFVAEGVLFSGLVKKEKSQGVNLGGDVKNVRNNVAAGV